MPCSGLFSGNALADGSSVAFYGVMDGAAYTEGNSEEPGTGNRQFAMGLRHRF